MHQRMIVTMLNANPRFKVLRKDDYEKVFSVMRPMHYSPGDVVTARDELEEYIYIIERGECRALDPCGGDPDGRGATSGAAGGSSGGGVEGGGSRWFYAGDTLGDKLMLGGKAEVNEQTVVAATGAKLWVLSVGTFASTVRTALESRAALLLEVVRSVPMMRTLVDPTRLGRLKDALEIVEYAEGQAIVTRGEVGHSFHIVMGGVAKAVVDEGHPGGYDYVSNDNVLQVYERGDHFGGTCLLRGCPHASTVVAASGVQCAVLTREAFWLHAGGGEADPAGAETTGDIFLHEEEKAVEAVRRSSIRPGTPEAHEGPPAADDPVVIARRRSMLADAVQADVQARKPNSSLVAEARSLMRRSARILDAKGLSAPRPVVGGARAAQDAGAPPPPPPLADAVRRDSDPFALTPHQIRRLEQIRQKDLSARAAPSRLRHSSTHEDEPGEAPARVVTGVVGALAGALGEGRHADRSCVPKAGGARESTAPEEQPSSSAGTETPTADEMGTTASRSPSKKQSNRAAARAARKQKEDKFLWRLEYQISRTCNMDLMDEFLEPPVEPPVVLPSRTRVANRADPMDGVWSEHSVERLAVDTQRRLLGGEAEDPAARTSVTGCVDRSASVAPAVDVVKEVGELLPQRELIDDEIAQFRAEQVRRTSYTSIQVEADADDCSEVEGIRFDGHGHDHVGMVAAAAADEAAGRARARSGSLPMLANPIKHAKRAGKPINEEHFSTMVLTEDVFIRLFLVWAVRTTSMSSGLREDQFRKFALHICDRVRMNGRLTNWHKVVALCENWPFFRGSPELLEGFLRYVSCLDGGPRMLVGGRFHNTPNPKLEKEAAEFLCLSAGGGGAAGASAGGNGGHGGEAAATSGDEAYLVIKAMDEGRKCHVQYTQRSMVKTDFLTLQEHLRGEQQINTVLKIDPARVDLGPEPSHESAVIAEGSTATVRRARYNGADVVVKVVNPTGRPAAEARDIMVREVELLDRLPRSPVVVNMLGYCMEGDKPMIVFDDAGEALDRLLEADAKLPRHLRTYTKLHVRLRLARDAAAALWHLHENNIVHCDIAPRNFLVQEHAGGSHKLRIADFGLGHVRKRPGELEPDWNELQVERQAPEVLMLNAISPKSDVYSFGLMLWEMATGSTIEQVWRGLGANPVVIISNESNPLRHPRIPDNLQPKEYWQLLEWCWMWECDQRPTFKQVFHELDRCVKKYEGELEADEAALRSANVVV